MKRFALPSLLAVLVFAQACTDATSPDRHATLTPTNPHAVLGNVPPPPTRSAVVISVASSVLVGEFTGVYFASGGSSSSAAAADELADATLAWNGTAWLRLDNTQTLGSLASANARFQVTRGLTTDPNFSGRGTLTISGHKITIDRVTFFAPNPDCLPGALCATIEFDASVDGVAGHHGTVQAFDMAVCTSVFIPDETVESGGFYFPFCPFSPEG
jgi:hypothetical protein